AVIWPGDYLCRHRPLVAAKAFEERSQLGSGRPPFRYDFLDRSFVTALPLAARSCCCNRDQSRPRPNREISSGLEATAASLKAVLPRKPAKKFEKFQTNRTPRASKTLPAFDDWVVDENICATFSNTGRE